MIQFDVRIEYRNDFPPDTRTLCTFGGAERLVARLRDKAPNIREVVILHARQPGQEIPLVSGDIVQVAEGKFRGCVLTLLDITTHDFVCQNDSYGEYNAAYNARVIHTTAVEFFRKPLIVEVPSS